MFISSFLSTKRNVKDGFFFFFVFYIFTMFIADQAKLLESVCFTFDRSKP